MNFLIILLFFSLKSFYNKSFLLNNFTNTIQPVLKPTSTPLETESTEIKNNTKYYIMFISFLLFILVIIWYFYNKFKNFDDDLKYTKDIIGDDAFEFTHIDAI